MVSVINKLKPFSEWYDMDDQLARAIQHSIKKRECAVIVQGKPIIQFAGKQPEGVQSSLTQANELLKKANPPTKAADDLLPKTRSTLNRLRPLNEDIKTKRKATQVIRDRAEKSGKKTASASAKLEALKTRNPASPEVTKLNEEYNRALAQSSADQDALDKREALMKTEDREYKKELFLTILTALEEYATGKSEAVEGLISIGEELAGVGAEVPFFVDPGKDQLQSQLQALREEPLE
jgi:hypothetical protein